MITSKDKTQNKKKVINLVKHHPRDFSPNQIEKTHFPFKVN